MTGSNLPFETVVRTYGKAAIADAAELIRSGYPVAVATETVYGLAADATSPDAVSRIYHAKGRPSFNPLIVHVRDVADARKLARFNRVAETLAARFWPGPITLVLQQTDDCAAASIVTAGLDTIAIRCPAHPAMQALLEAAACPLAAPSANASGRISPTRADHVAASLAGRIPLILDCGPTSQGIESTIVAPEEDRVRLLRPGPITAEMIENATQLPVVTPAGNKIEAPGQLVSHYAPSKPLRLNAHRALADEWLIGFGVVDGASNLSPAGDLAQAAARLFDLLHEADASHYASIAVAPIPRHGLGLAINDRLARAAA